MQNEDFHPNILLQSFVSRVLEHHSIHNQEIESADAAVASCLESASKAYLKIKHVEPILAAARDTISSSGIDFSIQNTSNTSTSNITNHSASYIHPPQTKRKRSGNAHQRISASAALASPGISNSAPFAPHPTPTHDQDTLLAPSPPTKTSQTITLVTASTTATTNNAATGSNKGLKHFSLKVCEKVEEKGSTNYNEVADELVKEMAADAAAGLGEGSYDEKNIRRRVYDALNVLEALGMLEKGKKDIQWKGWPPALGQQPVDRLTIEKAKAAARLERKAAMAAAVAGKAFCMSNLVLRNDGAPYQLFAEATAQGVPTPNPLALPFMLLHAPANASIDITISEDQKKASLEFGNWPFQVYDDERVMKMMGLGEPCPHLTKIALEKNPHLTVTAASLVQHQLEEQQKRKKGLLGAPGEEKKENDMEKMTPVKPMIIAPIGDGVKEGAYTSGDQSAHGLADRQHLASAGTLDQKELLSPSAAVSAMALNSPEVLKKKSS